jgi:predicted phage terminase large subunit-like protein
MLCSYAATFASRWGRRCRNLITSAPQTLRCRLAKDSRAADEWETTECGGMKTAGVGGDITGRGFDFGIVDDPVKNAADAWSDTIRETHWDWWTSTFYTRAEPGASLVIVQTRWHEDDLSGRILSESAEAWDVLRFPAIAEEDDALGRRPGEALWPERWPVDQLERIQHEVGTWVWESLYQQRPRPGSGAIWQREWLRHWAPALDVPHVMIADGGVSAAWPNCRRFATVDLAMTTKESSDWTVIAVWGQHGRHLFLLDLLRRRMEAPEILREIERVYRQWECSCAVVESVQGQLYICQLLRQRGLSIREEHPDKDKRARYMAAVPRWERGEVFFPATAPWLKALESELLSAPAARHDDQADACAMAAIVSAVSSADPRSLLRQAERQTGRPLDFGIAKPLGLK